MTEPAVGLDAIDVAAARREATDRANALIDRAEG